MSEAPVVRVEDLRVHIHSEGQVLRIIDGIDLEVAPGHTLCLVGESGCGKSVTALALMGLLPMPPARIASGRVLFEGQDLVALDPKRLQDLRGDRLAMIFQEPMTSLNPVFTIGRQLCEVIERHRDVDARQARAVALDMLNKVRIPEPERRLDQYPHQLSGGMRQRVMIAMALANQPKLLIADEPTTALDVTIQAQILRLIKNLQDQEGTAVILITHDLGVVAELADEVAVMYAGRIVERAPVQTLFDDPQHPYTLGLMNALPRLDQAGTELGTIAGSVPPAHAFGPGCRFASRCPFADDRCRAEAPPLVRVGPAHVAACWKIPLEDHFAQPEAALEAAS
ncbi:MAG: ABC transporter ATP-binding protein [Geminicoccaceae bacterium]|nr:MAG: ABC transporter ATP-binding protein [Geminicoccaceae bacterium]